MTAAEALPDGLDIVGVRTAGLGDTTYLVTYEGRGMIVDPQRDVDRFLAHMETADVELRWILETHLHNDYVSGGVVAADRSGAELVLPAAAAPVFEHKPAFHLEDLGDSQLTVRPIHTPGHTPEHTSYLLIVENEPIAVFSGGSLLVGSAGRPDLLGRPRADSLARLQYGSVQRLAELPDRVGLYPTHGAGSFCTVTGAGESTSTIGAEKRANPVLAFEDEDSFVAGQLADLQPFPSYYRHMGPANLSGGTPIPDGGMPVLLAEEVAAMAGDVRVIDIRDRFDFAAGHIPGSLGVELRDDFGVWVGWLVDIEERLVLVADSSQDPERARIQLARIGYDNIEGALQGLDGWISAGLPVAGFETSNLGEISSASRDGAPILDVRSPGEYAEGHIAGSRHVYVPDVEAADLDGLRGREVGVVCTTGYRATIAAGLLERKGLTPRPLVRGGVPDLIATETAVPRVGANT